MGKQVDQSFPESQLCDPSLLPGAAVSTLGKADVFLCRLGSRLLFFFTSGETDGKLEFGGVLPAATPLRGQREASMRSVSETVVAVSEACCAENTGQVLDSVPDAI